MNKHDIVISGTKKVCRDLKIPEPPISFVSHDMLENLVITGLFDNEKYELLFNEDWMMVSSDLEVLATVVHECRHAYQQHSINTQTNHPKEVLDKWDYEKKNYILPSGLGEKHDLAYLSQDIEIDAIGFTHAYMKKVFNAQTYLPKSIKEEISKRHF